MIFFLNDGVYISKNIEVYYDKILFLKKSEGFLWLGFLASLNAHARILRGYDRIRCK